MRTLHVDTVNFGVSHYFAYIKGYNADKYKTAVLEGVLRHIPEICHGTGCDKVAFYFDGTGNLRDGYRKAHKWKKRKKFKNELHKLGVDEAKRQVKALEGQLRGMGMSAVHSFPGYEREDLIARAVSTQPGGHVILSGDRDMLQCLSKKVSMLDWKRDCLWTPTRFMREKGVSPKDWPMVLAVGGHSSNDFWKIDGIGEQTAVSYVRGELEGGSRFLELISKEADKIKMNLIIMTLPYLGTPEIEPVDKDRIMKSEMEKHMMKCGLQYEKEKTIKAWERILSVE
jgi:5'-3' exonuclease